MAVSTWRARVPARLVNAQLVRAMPVDSDFFFLKCSTKGLGQARKSSVERMKASECWPSSCMLPLSTVALQTPGKSGSRNSPCHHHTHTHTHNHTDNHKHNHNQTQSHTITHNHKRTQSYTHTYTITHTQNHTKSQSHTIIQTHNTQMHANVMCAMSCTKVSRHALTTFYMCVCVCINYFLHVCVRERAFR